MVRLHNKREREREREIERDREQKDSAGSEAGVPFSQCHVMLSQSVCAAYEMGCRSARRKYEAIRH